MIFAHLLAACLFHDIGFVRGILKGDSPDGYVTDTKGSKKKLERGSSDAALMPYHVDRSKLFVIDRIAKFISMVARGEPIMAPPPTGTIIAEISALAMRRYDCRSRTPHLSAGLLHRPRRQQAGARLFSTPQTHKISSCDSATGVLFMSSRPTEVFSRLRSR